MYQRLRYARMFLFNTSVSMRPPKPPICTSCIAHDSHKPHVFSHHSPPPSVEYGVDRSWTTPALDVLARGTTNARIELSLNAQRDPNFPFAPCTLANLATSRAVDGQFSLTSQSSVGSSSAQFTCAYAVTCPSMTVALSPYPVAGVVPAVATLTVGLGAYLQVRCKRACH